MLTNYLWYEFKDEQVYPEMDWEGWDVAWKLGIVFGTSLVAWIVIMLFTNLRYFGTEMINE